MAEYKQWNRKTRFNKSLTTSDYEKKEEKIAQLSKLEITSLIAGECLYVYETNETLEDFYNKISNCTKIEKNKFEEGFDSIYTMRANARRFNVIDIDCFGYPDKFFPLVFELMEDEALLVFTFPIVGVNCLNGVVEQKFYNFYKNVPTIGDVVGCITDWGLREWMMVSLVDVMKMKRIYRFAFKCKRVNARLMCGIKSNGK